MSYRVPDVLVLGTEESPEALFSPSSLGVPFMVSAETVQIDILLSIVTIAVAGGVGEGIIRFLRRSADPTLAVTRLRLVQQLIRIAWIGIAALFVLTIWGVASDVLTAAVIGIIALVVSLGLQNTIANMISGIYLLSDGAIRVGDRIEHFTIKGTVVRVALRNTWVRTGSGEIAVIGNTKLADGPTLNLDLTTRFDEAHQAKHHATFPRWRKSPTPSPAPPEEAK